MCNSDVTTKSDKISFIHSNLVKHSLAAQMMQASTLDPTHIDHNYAIFRPHFLEVFRLEQHHDSLEWIFHLADSLTTGLGSLNYQRAQAAAASVARDAIESLTKASWLENGPSPFLNFIP